MDPAQRTVHRKKRSAFTLGLAICILSLWRKQRRNSNSHIYVDYNGTTPVVGPVVLNAMLPYLQRALWGS
jgi:hypothetical protein